MDIPHPTPSTGTMTGSDKLFIVFLILVLGLVTWLGSMNYHEGQKEEETKRNGEAWLAWFTDMGGKRHADDFPADHPCSPQSKPDLSPTHIKEGKPITGTWGPCLAQAMTESSLKDLKNPFSQQALNLVESCDAKNHKVSGSLVLEEMSPTPAGSPVPFVNSSLADLDPIDHKLQVRITVCNKGGGPIRIGEVEF